MGIYSIKKEKTLGMFPTSKVTNSGGSSRGSPT